MTCFLGVDIGTFETKAVLSDASGKVLAQAAHRHEMRVPRPGWAEHDAENDWWGDFVHVTRAVLAQSGVAPESVAAIGCSAIGPCMLPVDGDGRALDTAVLYGVDTRAQAEIAELTDRIGEAALLTHCGNALTTQSVGPKILWLARNRPEIFAKAAKIVSATTFLVQRLTGECVIDHYTAAGFSPLYDAGAQAWSDALAGDVIGLDRLPRLVWSNEIVGGVTAQAAAATGLAPGTKVIAGTIDAAAEAISVGVEAPGDMMMMYGSTIFIIQITAARSRDARLWYAPWLFPGAHAAMAGLATSGTLTHWFRDQMARDLDPARAFATLAEEAAASPPGANGLLLLPYFSGERTPIHDPNARGVFFGLDLTHTRGDMYRALLEGVAFAAGHVIETFRETGQPPSRVFAVGGGTRNRIWTQATSDVTGLPQILRERTFGASYGDAYLAALAVGAARPGDISAWNPVAATMAPDPDLDYAAQYAIWRQVYERTRDLMAALPGASPAT